MFKLLPLLSLFCFLNVYAEQKMFNITIGSGDNVRTAAGMYDEERGLLVVHTKGGLSVGPIIPAKDKEAIVKDKTDAREALRN